MDRSRSRSRQTSKGVFPVRSPSHLRHMVGCSSPHAHLHACTPALVDAPPLQSWPEEEKATPPPLPPPPQPPGHLSAFASAEIRRPGASPAPPASRPSGGATWPSRPVCGARSGASPATTRPRRAWPARGGLLLRRLPLLLLLARLVLVLLLLIRYCCRRRRRRRLLRKQLLLSTTTPPPPRGSGQMLTFLPSVMYWTCHRAGISST